MQAIPFSKSKSSESVNLDLLRSVAVLCVFCSHFFEALIVKNDLTWHVGRLGVLMFFVHTSLVLMFSMERMRFTGWTLAKSFYIRRAFRIYPLSMLCVVVYYNWFPTFSRSAREWTRMELFSNLTLTQNLLARENVVGVLWSLPLEVQMYLCLPVLFLLFRNRSVWWLAALWVAALPVALIPSHTTERIDILEYVPCFLAGVIAWRIIRQFQSRTLPAWLWPVSLSVPAAIWMYGPQKTSLPYRWVCAIALGLLIPFFRELSWKPLQQCVHVIAKYSYGIYLVHVGAFLLVYELRRYYPQVPSVIRWALCVFLVTVVPVALYHFVEEPFIRMGRKISDYFAEPRDEKQMALSAVAE